VATISPTATLFEVAAALTDGDLGVIVVGDADHVEAVVSERDVVRAVAAGRDLATTRAIDVAHRQIVWCEASAPLAEVANEMMVQYVRHVLLEDRGKLVGIVSARDLLGAYAADEST
jgi:CBS domain-containing protein